MSVVQEIGPGFFNFRGSYKIVIGLIDIGTHMSLIRLSTGRFLVVDAIPITDTIKAELDKLTDNGTKIEAFIASHPFHTLSIPSFHKFYPQAAFYGCPRHLKKFPEITWSGDLNDCNARNKWSPEVEMRVPTGSEFISPMPEKSNHFSCVFVYHKASRTIHVDDTIMYCPHPGFLLKLGGFRDDSMSFHPSMKNVGLQPHANAPLEFRDFVNDVLKDWDFDNICTAHMGNKVGGAKPQLQQLLKDSESMLNKLAEKRKNNPNTPDEETTNYNVSGSECG